MSNIRRAPKWHHYWCLMSTMPPLKHRGAPHKSAVLDWLMKQANCEREAARCAFESAKQARYLVMKDGAWRWDALSGFLHWQKLPPASPAPEAALSAQALSVWGRLRDHPPARPEDAVATAAAVVGNIEGGRAALNELFAAGRVTELGTAL